MADPLYNSYFAPLDNLVGSQAIGSPSEIISNQAIQSGADKNQTFQQILNSYKKPAGLPPAPGSFSGCNPLIAIDCDPQASLDKSRERVQNEIENTVGNIVNADKPGFKKVLPFRDENGNVLYDESNGALQRTNWQLDLAVMGEGKGFELVNGQFTRDGRFKFGKDGNLVTVQGEIPLKICYQDGAPVDWSMKRLKIDFEGKVVDEQTGQYLGQVQADKDERGKVLQSYIEKSNVNLPVEFMGLAQKLRLIDLTNGIFSTGMKLDSEAVQLLSRLQ